MKNRDYVKENKIEDVLITVAELGHCALCDKLGIREYCNKHDEMDCKETILNWMKEEHPLYPIGAILEVKSDYIGNSNNRIVGYYAGNYNNQPRLVGNSVNIGKPSIGVNFKKEDVVRILSI